MFRYAERRIAGEMTTWPRARQLVFDNPLEGPSLATCYETEAKQFPDGTLIEKNLNTMSVELTDPPQQIPIINLETWEQTEETFSADYLWLLLASLYIWMSKNNSPPTGI